MLPADFPNPTLVRFLETGGINRADRRPRKPKVTRHLLALPANTRRGRDGRIRHRNGTHAPLFVTALPGAKRLTIINTTTPAQPKAA